MLSGAMQRCPAEFIKGVRCMTFVKQSRHLGNVALLRRQSVIAPA
jgi:hypothetical protein